MHARCPSFAVVPGGTSMRGDFPNHRVFSRTARAVVAGGCGAILLVAGTAHADPAPPARSYAADNPSLEGWVEDELQAMMGSCVGGKLKMLKKKAFGGAEEVAVSAIPPLISDGLELGLKPQITLQD